MDDAPGAFPVVCVGGSAGGLKAYRELLRHFPVDLGVAVVIVNHVRTAASLLPSILPGYTNMPVQLITEELPIQPNRVYIIPSNRDLRVLEGTFRLVPISKAWGWPNVITIFLRSLATSWKGKLIAIIVSGYDDGGADALCEIKALGGITIAQTNDTAEVGSMPRGAIDTGCIDLVLAPQEIERLIREAC